MLRWEEKGKKEIQIQKQQKENEIKKRKRQTPPKSPSKGTSKPPDPLFKKGEKEAEKSG